MLRTEEGCPRDLATIPIPDGGYTVDYLKAVVHNAKIYIRPLQSDLSLDPRPADVCVHPLSFYVVSMNWHYRVCYQSQRRCTKSVTGLSLFQS